MPSGMPPSESVQGHEQLWSVVQGKAVSNPKWPPLHQVQVGLQDQEEWHVLG